MAKMNLTNQQNQENSSVVVTLASLGVLMCMVVTVLGIKLWWFKHRLSFEQTSTQNGAAGGPPMVVVPRKNKKHRFNKDKRWSQQISENVEVHGVFRQKQEDDFDIQRPQQLPPVRIRQQLSGSTQSLILPPPRNKPRQKLVNSTAFEDMEIDTPTFGNSPAPSSLVLTGNNGSDTRLSLTFEEFEKQFKIKEIKPEIFEPPPKTEVIEKPVPPLRLSRSSSEMQKPEKSQHFLKSSQSITIPEFHKVIERRPTGFSRPTEDLTKIDDYEQPPIFEKFGERRPTGYIKYEEVDRDLNERYEQELNQMKGNSNQGQLFDYKFTENGNWVSAKDLQALEVLRNERIIYQNDLNESPENFNAKSFTTSFSYDDFMKIRDKDYHDFSNRNVYEIHKSFETVELSSKDYEGYHSIKHRRPAGHVRDEHLKLVEPDEDIHFKPVKDRRPTEFVGNIPQDITNDLSISIDSASIQDDFDNQFSNWPQFEEKIETPKVNVRKFENHDFERPTSVDDSEDTTIKTEKPSVSSSLTETDTFDQEIVEKTRMNQRRPTGYNRNWVEENIEPGDLSESEREKSSLQQKTLYSQLRSLMKDETKETPDKPEVRFEISDDENSVNEDFEKSTLKQRRPTGFVRREKEEAKENELENSEYENNENSDLNQRRATGFERNDIKLKEDQTVRSVNFDFTENKDFEKSSLKQRRPTGYVRNKNKEIDENYIETQKQKVKFEISNCPEDNVEENYSLNQRRPTGYIRNPVTSRDSDEDQGIVINEIKGNGGQLSESLPDDLEDFEKWIEKQRHALGYNKALESNEMLSKDSTKNQVTFDYSIDFEGEKEYANSKLKERRPTGYIKKTQAKVLTDEDESELKVSFATSTDFKESNENSYITQRRPTGFIKKLPELYIESTDSDNQANFKNPSARIQEIEQTGSEVENFPSLVKERRPTGFVTTPDIDKLFGSSKEVNFNLNDLPDEENLKRFENEALKARRPTGYVQISEIENFDNLEIDHSPHSNKVDPLWQELEKDLDQDFTQNVEEEFSKIRHSYEMNEADFLELQKELQKSQIKPTGFGKTIEDDWDNFEKLKTPKIMKDHHQEIQIICNAEELSTTSILKESKILIENQQIIEHQEEIKVLPRKSKVTFDFKTEEHIIPARNTELDSEEDDYYEDISDYDDDDDNVYNKPPPAIPPPQPMQRLSHVNYNVQSSTSPTSIYTPIVAKPTAITLFGTQISQEDNVDNDSWSAIRKHRNLTVEFQQLSIDSTSTSPPPSFSTPSPKPAFRNPLAQLAIQRAKEVRMDMDGFKPRTINDVKKHPEASKRNREKMLNLHNDDFADTEA